MWNFIKQHKALFLIILIFSLSLVLFFAFYHYRYNCQNKVLKNLSNIDLNGYHKLMIVAHPDDEMLFGGAALIQDDYLVVCVTCGSDEERVKEFKNVMNETNDRYIMLYYPDKVLGKRSEWKNERKNIEEDIELILNYKDWDMIVTHNAAGEYGHIHHKMTHNIVFSLANEEQKKHLNVFNTYCSFNQIQDGNCESIGDISDDLVLEKERIMFTYYKSQKNTINKLKHIIPYENLIKG